MCLCEVVTVTPCTFYQCGFPSRYTSSLVNRENQVYESPKPRNSHQGNGDLAKSSGQERLPAVFTQQQPRPPKQRANKQTCPTVLLVKASVLAWATPDRPQALWARQPHKLWLMHHCDLLSHSVSQVSITKTNAWDKQLREKKKKIDSGSHL